MVRKEITAIVVCVKIVTNVHKKVCTDKLFVGAFFVTIVVIIGLSSNNRGTHEGSGSCC